MTTLPDLDRLHAEATPGPWKLGYTNRTRSCVDNEHQTVARTDTLCHRTDAELIVALRNAYPALRAYVAALEAERDASRALLAALDDGSTLVNTGPDRRAKVGRLYNSRLATDAAREKMEEDADA